jgi:hypothetical protein
VASDFADKRETIVNAAVKPTHKLEIHESKQRYSRPPAREQRRIVSSLPAREALTASP